MGVERSAKSAKRRRRQLADQERYWARKAGPVTVTQLTSDTDPVRLSPITSSPLCPHCDEVLTLSEPDLDTPLEMGWHCHGCGAAGLLVAVPPDPGA